MSFGGGPQTLGRHKRFGEESPNHYDRMLKLSQASDAELTARGLEVKSEAIALLRKADERDEERKKTRWIRGGSGRNFAREDVGILGQNNFRDVDLYSNAEAA